MVQLSGLLRKNALVWPLPPNSQGIRQKCVVRHVPEDATLLQELGRKLGVPYHGTGAAAFGYTLLLRRLRRRRSASRKFGKAQCFLCGAEAEQTHHAPPLSRNTTKSSEEPICCACHAEVTNADAKFDAGWAPLTSTLCPHTAQYMYLPREKPFCGLFQ